MVKTLALSVTITLAASVASAQDQQKIQDEVSSVDAARSAALSKGDGHAWGEVIADNCLWVDMSTGEVQQDKAERISSIDAAGGFDAGTQSDVKYHVEENRVVQTGSSSIMGRFARIYAKNDAGKWNMIALYMEHFPAQ